MITAKQAKDMTNASKGCQMKSIENRIKEEAAKGNTYCSFSGQFNTGVQEVLEEKGFRIEYVRTDFRYINW